MAKYINKDEAYKIVLHYGSYVASNKINDMPSIDLVMCGECGWSDSCTYISKEYDGWEYWYCADGERREE